MNRNNVYDRRPLRVLRAGVVLLPLVWILAGADARASTPRSLVTSVIDTPSSDLPADRLALTATVVNGYREPVVVAFAPEQRQELSLEVTPSMITLAPGARAVLRVTGRVSTEGKQAVFLPGTVSSADGLLLEETVLELHMRVVRDAAGGLRARLSDYLSLFIDEGHAEVPGIGLAYPGTSGVPGQEAPEDGAQGPERLPVEPQLRASPNAMASATRQLTVKGQWRWIDQTGAVRSGVGWRVVLYYWNGSKWVDSGSRAWVGSNSSYSVTGAVPTSAKARVTIYPSNRYFDLVNGKGHKYNFSLPEFLTSLNLYDYGGYYIKKDVVPGLGEMHRSAYDLWWRLENVAQFSPLRVQPIRIVFPGTSDCGSCSQNGTIHVEAARGTNNRTVRHELGHELMFEYWGGMPEGSGGPHNWTKCYNTGLALSEGFAHFTSWWSTVNRTTLAGSWGTGHNGESLSSTVCQGIGTNELRVAATFWDLHDQKIDGDDDFSYLHEGTIFRAILLNGSPFNSLSSMIGQLEDYAGVEWEKVETVAEYNFTD